MPDSIQSIFDLPDVSFIENDTLDAMMQRMVSNFEMKYEEVAGKPVSLAPADHRRLLLYTAALELFQLEQYVDRAGKQDLLKYSYGEYLDNLAGNRSVVRQKASAAVTTLRFSIDQVLNSAVGIPEGTRATNGNGVDFETTEYAEIPAGSKFVDVLAQCTEEGIVGNDFLPGQINDLVETLSYISSVENITTTAGGTDLETDESLAERVFLAPSSYSVAGPEDGYIYFARTYNTGIGSVKIESPNPCDVEIYVLMKDGTLPPTEVTRGLEAFLMDGKSRNRPLTDRVSVKAPGVHHFNIELTYYINRSNASSALTIQDEVREAIDEYVLWQTSEIGRDINPSELIRRIISAGAKRVEINAPVFDVVSGTEVAQLLSKAVNYGGLEDD